MSHPIDWEAVRVDYVASSLTLQQIYAKFRISPQQLKAYRTEHNWPDPRPKLGEQNIVSDAVIPAAPDQPTVLKRRTKKLTAAERRGFVNRLIDAIESDLALLEKRIEKHLASTTAAKSTDTERDTRTIGLIIKNLEQINVYANADDPSKNLHGAAARSAHLARTELADEADRRRRELEERLSRLVGVAQTPTPPPA